MPQHNLPIIMAFNVQKWHSDTWIFKESPYCWGGGGSGTPSPRLVSSLPRPGYTWLHHWLHHWIYWLSILTENALAIDIMKGITIIHHSTILLGSVMCIIVADQGGSAINRCPSPPPPPPHPQFDRLRFLCVCLVWVYSALNQNFPS